MATIMVHPTAEGIGRRISEGYRSLDIQDRGGTTAIFITNRAVLDALTRALGEIRAAMDAQDARDQVPTEMADWPSTAAPGELLEVFGK